MIVGAFRLATFGARWGPLALVPGQNPDSDEPIEDPWPCPDNAFTDLAGGDYRRAQLALHALEGHLGDLPDPPDDFQRPDPAQTQAILRRGWGEKCPFNLRLARAAVAEYDRAHAGQFRQYLERTGYGDDPTAFRLAASALARGPGDEGPVPGGGPPRGGGPHPGAAAPPGQRRQLPDPPE